MNLKAEVMQLAKEIVRLGEPREGAVASVKFGVLFNDGAWARGARRPAPAARLARREDGFRPPEAQCRFWAASALAHVSGFGPQTDGIDDWSRC